MSLLGDIGNNLANAAAIGARDYGHLLNATGNIITGQGIHGSGNSMGSGLINASHASGYGGGPIFDLANRGTTSTSSGSSQGSPSQSPLNQGMSSPTTIYGGGGSGGGYYSTPDGQAALQRQQGIDQINSAIGRLGNQLNIANSNIQSQYGQNLNELNSALNSAKNQYNTSSTQNQQTLRSNKNTITDQASAGLRGLMRTLGAYGAGGSSDALNASQAVTNQANLQRNGAGENFAQNQQSLDTNWGNYQNQDKNKRSQLNDWRTQQLNSAKAQSDSTKQNLLTQLAGLQSSTGAAQPYLDQANALSGQIDALGRINPTYSGTTPVYQAPSLSSYDTGSGTGTTLNPTQGGDSATILASLLGLDPNKKQQPLSY